MQCLHSQSLFQVIEEEDCEKRKSSKSSNKPELEDLNFLLKSGIVLCRLIHKIFPRCQIDLESLQVPFFLQLQCLSDLLFSVWKSEHEEEEHLSVPDIRPGLRTA